MFDDALDFFTGGSSTLPGSARKLDYLAWQDSIATLRRAFIFDSQQVPTAGMPDELADMQFGGVLASDLASDHLPVIADSELPPAGPLSCPADFDDNGVVEAADLAELLSAWGLCP